VPVQKKKDEKHEAAEPEQRSERRNIMEDEAQVCNDTEKNQTGKAGD